MLRISLIVLAMALMLAAQEIPKTWTPANEPAPKVGEWLPPKVADGVPTVVRVAPPPTTGVCSIPLLEVAPQANTRMRRMQPKDGGTMQFVTPPAPACEGWTWNRGDLKPRVAPRWRR